MHTQVHPLIEQYIRTTSLTSPQQHRRLTRFSPGHHAPLDQLHAAERTAYAYIDKYHFTTSALTMTSYLQPPGPATIVRLPDLPTWIEAEPIMAPHRCASGLLFWCPAHPAFSPRWELVIVGGQGNTLYHFAYHPLLTQWSLSPRHCCPFASCCQDQASLLSSVGDGQQRPCRRCREALLHWQSWFATALLMLQGVFADTASERECVTRSVTRHTDHRGEAAQTILHQYHIVTFDACLSRSPNPHQPGPSTPADPAPLSKEPSSPIDPAAFVSVTRSIASGRRLLDPARCSRWKSRREVDVHAHEKRVWLRLDRLQRRFTNVIASAFSA